GAGDGDHLRETPRGFAHEGLALEARAEGLAERAVYSLGEDPVAEGDEGGREDAPHEGTGDGYELDLEIPRARGGEGGGHLGSVGMRVGFVGAHVPGPGRVVR